MSGVSKKARNVPKKWLGAFKKGHRFSDREYIDEDQAWEMLERWEKSGGTDKEAESVLDYLTKFNNEYYKGVIKKGDKNALHNTDELRKSVYDRQNAKNRDIMSIQNRKKESKANQKANSNEEEFDAFNPNTNPDTDQFYYDQNKGGAVTNYVEDALIELLDAQVAIYNMEDDTEH